MLAEPRYRQKYSVNPRGLDWSNDESKLGQKLLEKMGWKKGKALGLNEDGIKEHVKVKAKSDRKGVGCTKQHADNWIAHQDDFNAILSSLNGDSNTGDSNSVFNNLHEKSKSSRSRVHYEKFTKGKDLSSYKDQDLSCIFGQRQNKTDVLSEVEKCEGASESNADASFGVKTVTSMTSIESYFAMKMAARNNSQPQMDTVVAKPEKQKSKKCKMNKDTSDEPELQNGLESCLTGKDRLMLQDDKSTTCHSKAKKRKSRNLVIETEPSAESATNEVTDTRVSADSEVTQQNGEHSLCNKKSKKKKCRTVESADEPSVSSEVVSKLHRKRSKDILYCNDSTASNIGENVREHKKRKLNC